jgi:hypothetical protein
MGRDSPQAVPKPGGLTQTAGSRRLGGSKRHSPSQTNGATTVTTTTTEVATVSSQQISLLQSVETVQKLLLGCVSNLTSMRNMFRQACYHWKFYESPLNVDGPEDYPPGVLFISLKKGISSNVDRLFELLVKCPSGLCVLVSIINGLHIVGDWRCGRLEERLSCFVAFLDLRRPEPSPRYPRGMGFQVCLP